MPEYTGKFLHDENYWQKFLMAKLSGEISLCRNLLAKYLLCRKLMENFFMCISRDCPSCRNLNGKICFLPEIRGRVFYEETLCNFLDVEKLKWTLILDKGSGKELNVTGK